MPWEELLVCTFLFFGHREKINAPEQGQNLAHERACEGASLTGSSTLVEPPATSATLSHVLQKVPKPHIEFYFFVNPLATNSEA